MAYIFSYIVCITWFFYLKWQPASNQNSIKSTIFWLLQLYFLIIVNAYGHGHNHLNHKYIHEIKPNIICKTFQIFHWNRNAKCIRWIDHLPSNLIISKFELQNIQWSAWYCFYFLYKIGFLYKKKLYGK